METMKPATLSIRKLLIVNEPQNTYDIKRKVDGITDARKAFNTVFQMNRLPDEIFAAMFLDCRLNINGMAEITRGVLSSSPITMRELFKYALAYNAHSLIVAHNHPSGCAEPSSFDKTVTQEIQSAAKIMNIYFHDHLIIADDEYFSFKENGFIEEWDENLW